MNIADVTIMNQGADERKRFISIATPIGDVSNLM